MYTHIHKCSKVLTLVHHNYIKILQIHVHYYKLKLPTSDFNRLFHYKSIHPGYRKGYKLASYVFLFLEYIYWTIFDK